MTLVWFRFREDTAAAAAANCVVMTMRDSAKTGFQESFSSVTSSPHRRIGLGTVQLAQHRKNALWLGLSDNPDLI